MDSNCFAAQPTRHRLRTGATPTTNLCTCSHNRQLLTVAECQLHCSHWPVAAIIAIIGNHIRQLSVGMQSLASCCYQCLHWQITSDSCQIECNDHHHCSQDSHLSTRLPSLAITIIPLQSHQTVVNWDAITGSHHYHCSHIRQLSTGMQPSPSLAIWDATITGNLTFTAVTLHSC